MERATLLFRILGSFEEGFVMKRLRTGLICLLKGGVGFLALYGALSCFLDCKGRLQSVDVPNMPAAVADISAKDLCLYASFVNTDFRGSLQEICIAVVPEGKEPLCCMKFLLPDGSIVSRHYRLHDIRFVGFENGQMQFEVKAGVRDA